MRKGIALLLTFAMMLSITACGAKEANSAETEAPETTPTESKESILVTPSVFTRGDLDSLIEADVEAVLADLNAEYESVIAGVDGYDTYMGKKAEIAVFYEKINTASEELCIKMCAYAIAYAEDILTSGKASDEMYDDMEIVYDLIYDDMGDEIYDGIYDGILDDIYDDFYDGALDDQPDNVGYSDWSKARSEEYEMWSNTRSDTYEQWSDFRSDVYEFWSDMRSEFWNDDLDDAQDELEDFREDVERKVVKAIASVETSSVEVEDISSAEHGIRPEFKEAMDSFEAFFDEYVAFMKAYMDSNDPLGMMEEYTSMMQQYIETMGELEDINEEELSEEEALYYAEVVLRINQKLLEVL